MSGHRDSQRESESRLQEISQTPRTQKLVLNQEPGPGKDPNTRSRLVATRREIKGAPSARGCQIVRQRQGIVTLEEMGEMGRDQVLLLKEWREKEDMNG